MMELADDNCKEGITYACEKSTTQWNCLGDSFQKYMTMFFPYVLIALKNREEYQVCSAAVGVCDDLSRVLKDRFAPYVPELMQLLYEILANTDNVKKKERFEHQ
ncbi:Importin subunit [Trichinella spiralis]|uniref:Importin subunit n=1 Tax=Trichinella spiralis TaxID=6334 RepID=A0ABR3KGF5_TRISP